MAEIIDQERSKIVRLNKHDVEFSYAKENNKKGIAIDIWVEGYPTDIVYLTESQTQSLIEFLQKSLKTETK